MVSPGSVERRLRAPSTTATTPPCPYTYGRGAGERTYWPQPWPSSVLWIRCLLEERLETTLDVCFLNRYEGGRDWLGWHADDSPEMDDARPIVTVSFGASRLIEFKRQNDRDGDREGLLLESGSAAVMRPGMQDEWFHRIPKVGAVIPPRISLTYRGFVK